MKGSWPDVSPPTDWKLSWRENVEGGSVHVRLCSMYFLSSGVVSDVYIVYFIGVYFEVSQRRRKR